MANRVRAMRGPITGLAKLRAIGVCAARKSATCKPSVKTLQLELLR
jgi:hypothetical protein